MTTPATKLSQSVRDPRQGSSAMDIHQSMRQVQHRYGTIALVITVAAGAGLMSLGFPTYGKGLILGAVFSVVNFIAMAVLLPLQFNPDRKKGTVLSFVSILLRYCLMAAPLMAAIKLPQFALSTVVVGLFMVQIAILGDQLWTRLRNSVEAKH
jgi:hypothetical protein